MKKNIVCFTLFLNIFNANAFDCDLSKNVIEKQICSNKELLDLDYSLNEKYIDAIENANLPENVKKDQQDWLKHTRSKCKETECLKDVYKNRLKELKLTTQYTWLTYTNKNLGVEFIYPSNRKVKEIKDGFYIYGFIMPEDHYYIMQFKINKGSFLKGNKKEGIFEKENGKWYSTNIRFMPVEAININGYGWTGMKANTICGISDKESGYHAAGGECLNAIISDGNKYINIDTSGILGLDDATNKTMMSIKFIK